MIDGVIVTPLKQIQTSSFFNPINIYLTSFTQEQTEPLN